MSLHLIRYESKDSGPSRFGIIVTPFVHPAMEFPVLRVQNGAEMKELLLERLSLQESNEHRQPSHFACHEPHDPNTIPAGTLRAYLRQLMLTVEAFLDILD